MKYLVSSLVLLGLMLQVVSDARAQTREITLLSPNPIEATINKLTADFEAKTGIHVKITYGTGVSTRKTVASGQALDVSLLFAPFPEALKTGNIDPKSATVIGRLRLAIAVRKGAPKPDIATPDAVRRMLRNAKSIVSVDLIDGTRSWRVPSGLAMSIARPRLTWPGMTMAGLPFSSVNPLFISGMWPRALTRA